MSSLLTTSHSATQDTVVSSLCS